MYGLGRDAGQRPSPRAVNSLQALSAKSRTPRARLGQGAPPHGPVFVHSRRGNLLRPGLRGAPLPSLPLPVTLGQVPFFMGGERPQSSGARVSAAPGQGESFRAQMAASGASQRQLFRFRLGPREADFLPPPPALRSRGLRSFPKVQGVRQRLLVFTRLLLQITSQARSAQDVSRTPRPQTQFITFCPEWLRRWWPWGCLRPALSCTLPRLLPVRVFAQSHRAPVRETRARTRLWPSHP